MVETKWGVNPVHERLPGKQTRRNRVHLSQQDLVEVTDQYRGEVDDAHLRLRNARTESRGLDDRLPKLCFPPGHPAAWGQGIGRTTEPCGNAERPGQGHGCLQHPEE